MSIHKRRFLWCLENKARMKKIEPDIKLAEEHVHKAKHNLFAMDYNIRGGFSDWAISQSYYAMYHALLALLFRAGYESRNHECTINAVEFLIDEGNIKLDKKDIAFIRITEHMKRKDAKSLREEFQYGTKTSVNDELMDDMVRNSKGIVERIEVALLSI